MSRVFITGSSDGLGLMAGTGGYFYHQRPRDAHPAAHDVTVQEELLGYCAELSGTELPR